MGPPEMMLQALAPALRHVGVGKQPGKQAEIAEGDAELRQARGLQRADRQLQHARLGGDAVAGAEPFEPGLREFLRAQQFVGKAEGGAQIAIALLGGGVARMAQVIAAGGHGEIGPQAHFGAGGIGEHEGPCTDVFARALEEDVGGLDDVGRDLVEAGALEHRHDGGVLALEGFAFGCGIYRPWHALIRRTSRDASPAQREKAGPHCATPLRRWEPASAGRTG